MYIPRRIAVLLIIIGIFAVLIVVQLIIIMSTGTYVAPSNQQTHARGNIFDRNQRILSMESTLDSIAAWMPDITDHNESVTILSEILRMERAQLAEKISGTGYVLIKRYATERESREIAEYHAAGKLDGVILQPIAGRIYPQRTHGSTVVGYIGTDNVGLDGIEYRFNSFLAPVAADDGRHGYDVFLTIDVVLQTFVDRLAVEVWELEEADAVMAVVMDAKNGEVLASSSIPDYDPNQFQRYPEQHRRNKTISTIYEPGSVFKIFSMAAILENGGIAENDFFNTDGGYGGQIEEYQITDINNYGVISAAEIIKVSSNVGAAIASDTISNQVFYDTLAAFGFGKRTGIALNGEENAIFRTVQEWTERTKPTVAIGQEIGVTAIQVAAAATAIAGDGRVLRPEIVRKIVASDGEVVYENTPKYVDAPISADTAFTMRTFMKGATEAGGTARRMRIDGLNISAKTGTAEVFDLETQQYSDEHFVASSIALFPTEDPQYIIYFVIDYPKVSSIYGGTLAAPRVRSIIEYITSYYRVKTERNASEIVNEIRLGVPRTRFEFDGKMPNLYGVSKAEVLAFLLHNNISADIVGDGQVVQQFPLPDVPYDRDTKVAVRFQ